MNTLWQDLRYGARVLLKQPGFTLIAVLTLALGIGANTAIFSVVNAVLLRPLPYAQPDRLVMIWGNFQKLNIERLPAKAAEYLDYKSQSQSFEQVAASSTLEYILTGGEQAERVAGTRMTANLFSLLGARVAQGRAFAPEDYEAGRDKVVIISHDFRQRRFGGDANCIGQTLRLSDQSYTIVGVMPAGFQFPHASLQFGEPSELWTPLTFPPERVAQRQGPYYLNVIARLKPGVTVEQARADMGVIAGNFEERNHIESGPRGEDGGWRITVTTLEEEAVGGSRFALLFLLGAVALVLLIACANVANLLLMRATVRQRELAIRSALGASRLALVRQLLIESLLLATMGGAIGLLLAWWGVDILTALSPENLPRVKEVNLDGRVVGFTFLLSLLTGLIFGVAPALQASKPDLQKTLKESGASVSSGRHWLRNLLVIGEVAIAMLLLVSAGLLINSLLRLQRLNPGVDADKTLMIEFSLPQSRYGEPAKASTFYRELVRRVESLPGVESASVSNIIPLSGAATNDPFSIEGRPFDMSNIQTAGWQRVLPNYFRTMGIPIVQGRDFSERDNDKSEGVAIVNETMARRYWPNESAIGKRITLGAPFPGNSWSTIIGVARDIPHGTVESRAEPDWYLPYLRGPLRDMRLFVRAAGDPANLASAVRAQVAAIDRDQPITSLATLDEVIASTVAERRFNTFVLGLFAAVALLLAALGIYSVISYSVTQRTQEIGVRMALGARARDVLKLVVRQGMMPTLVGVVIGLIGAFALTRLMKSLLYGVSATDPVTFAGVAFVLTAVALLACYIPARRAAKVDPMIALRHE